MHTDEYAFRLKVELLPEGVWLAESDDFPGLVAQGRTAEETIEIARDVARKLIESWEDHGDPLPPSIVPIDGSRSFDVAVSI
jgi:predicted RNase H-like HicB family nuclease